MRTGALPPLLCAALTGAPARGAAACGGGDSGVHCYGDDIADAGVVRSAAACCDLCLASSPCRWWTFNHGIDDHCWLKTACSDRRTGGSYHSS